MGMGRHYTTKSKSDSTYDPQWSGVSYAPHCGCTCPDCGEELHIESESHYCPRCDDFKPGEAHTAAELAEWNKEDTEE
jgi:acetone carboxylase gamma subunit